MIRELRRDRGFVVGAVIAAGMVLVAVTAPLLAGLAGQDYTTYHDTLLDSARGGVPIGSFGGISGEHWLGVEPGTGRDLFARLVHGAQVSVGVAVAATFLEVLLGVTVGVAAGLGGRWADAGLSRLIDLVLSVPVLVMAIALLAIVPQDWPRPLLLAVVIAVLGWGGTARISRGETLTLRTRDYVAAAQVAGAPWWRVARREILPGLTAPILTYAALLLPTNMVVEAGLSFLGVGVRPPTPSWGQMLSSATTWFRADPMYVFLPGLLLFLTLLSFVLVANGLRRVLDPRQREVLR
ncbi:peptide/nickel transport system permease protein [Actinoplanes octamycinicus]|uniref:Peptide/nickel transport system permease protein n=1 Tax=Actinoplanes octamycinicus TaxID=135948 RepID=A0A7W7MCK2_9ACTN|nr:ABC transporter permease [Actinoplanes octamycinicus]MBB4744915.1 peptide/nickel transport system permease protein [Actinoplanes octamycinicus]GIE55500.1 peptide ABC transporter permease [Actinoplanes octamycinicus]